MTPKVWIPGAPAVTKNCVICVQIGLQDLYNFKQENPHADLEPFLAKSSDYFRQYIERGLRTIEMEVRLPQIRIRCQVGRFGSRPYFGFGIKKKRYFFNSVVDPDPYSGASWIRIRVWNTADPDPHMQI